MSPSRTQLRRSAAVIASGVAIMLGAGSAQAAENGKIAFERFGEIFVANPDGKNATNLTATKTSEDQAVFSPDGTKIAFVRDSVTASLADDDLWVMNADGTGLERLLRGNFINRGAGGLLKPLWQPRSSGG